MGVTVGGVCNETADRGNREPRTGPPAGAWRVARWRTTSGCGEVGAPSGRALRFQARRSAGEWHRFELEVRSLRIADHENEGIPAMHTPIAGCWYA